MVLNKALEHDFLHFLDFFILLVFIQSKNDPSLFTLKSQGRIIIPVLYVDDIILTGNDSSFLDVLVS